MPSEPLRERDAPDRRGADSDELIVTKLSPWSLVDNVARRSAAVAARGMEVFAIVDHSSRPQEVGLELRDTRLVICGSSAAMARCRTTCAAYPAGAPSGLRGFVTSRGATWSLGT